MKTATDVMTEAQVQAGIVEAARELGWLCYHTSDSRRSEPGFPDLVLVRAPRVLFIECKNQRGNLSVGRRTRKDARWLPGQCDWRLILLACPGVEYYLARPSNLDEIYAILMTKEAPGCLNTLLTTPQ